MFSSKKQTMKEAEAASQASNIIGKGTQLEGNINTAGNLRIEGKVKGGLQSKAKIVLSDTAVVEGSIVAQNAEIGGEVQGTLQVAGLLLLKPTALVHGDIITSKLVFEEGAKCNGKCNMGGAVKETAHKQLSPDASPQNGSSNAFLQPTKQPAKKAKKVLQ